MQIDQGALAAHYGTNLLTDDPEANKLRADSDKQRDALREALTIKAKALADSLITSSNSTNTSTATSNSTPSTSTADKTGSVKDADASTAAVVAASDASEDKGSSSVASGDTENKESSKTAKEFAATYALLRQWDDVAAESNASKYAALNVAHHAAANRLGSALKVSYDTFRYDKLRYETLRYSHQPARVMCDSERPGTAAILRLDHLRLLDKHHHDLLSTVVPRRCRCTNDSNAAPRIGALICLHAIGV